MAYRKGTDKPPVLHISSLRAKNFKSSSCTIKEEDLSFSRKRKKESIYIYHPTCRWKCQLNAIRFIKISLTDIIGVISDAWGKEKVGQTTSVIMR